MVAPGTIPPTELVMNLGVMKVAELPVDPNERTLNGRVEESLLTTGQDQNSKVTDEYGPWD